MRKGLIGSNSAVVLTASGADASDLYRSRRPVRTALRAAALRAGAVRTAVLRTSAMWTAAAVRRPLRAALWARSPAMSGPKPCSELGPQGGPQGPANGGGGPHALVRRTAVRTAPARKAAARRAVRTGRRAAVEIAPSAPLAVSTTAAIAPISPLRILRSRTLQQHLEQHLSFVTLLWSVRD